MKINKILFTAAVALTLTACSSSRTSLPYFRDISTVSDGVLSEDVVPEVKIVNGDELAITVTSRVPEATAGYNMPMANPATKSDVTLTTTPRLQTYIVDTDGDITMPILGTIHVAGMTTKELQNYLTKRISADVEDPTVMVRFVEFYVNVMGEVARPQRIKVTTDRFSLLDALSSGGDLTQYGERDNVLLIREENGKRTFHRFNLNDAESLNSPYFYLQQNDVVYVSPNNTRQENSEYSQNNAFKVQVTSAIVSAVSVVSSLVIALVIK